MKNQILTLTTSYFLLRLLSFYTYKLPSLQAIIGLAILCALAYLFTKKPTHAWYLLLAELFLGGTGLTIEIFGLSLRLLMFITFLGLWFGTCIKRQLWDKCTIEDSPLLKSLIALAGVVALGMVLGLVNDHSTRAIVQDAIPFAYLLLIIPGYHIVKNQTNVTFYKSLLIAFILSSAIFSLLNLILFSSGLVELQEPYYKWLRDVLAAKTTHIGFDFWRIVLPEHLLLTPMILLLAGITMKEKLTKHKALLLTLLSLTLAITLSRGYMLALIGGLIVLKYSNQFKHWLTISAMICALVFGTFTASHLIASGGLSFGWEHFGIRFASIAKPDIERSASTRKLLIKPILEQIKQDPVFGNGLGGTVTFYNTFEKKKETSRHFDWGYLELGAELGIVGLTIFEIFLFILLARLWFREQDQQKITAIAIILSLCVFTVVGPGLFHLYGVVVIGGVVLYASFRATPLPQTHTHQHLLLKKKVDLSS